MRSSQQVHWRKVVLPAYSRHHSQKKKLILALTLRSSLELVLTLCSSLDLVLTLCSSLELVGVPRSLSRDDCRLNDSSSPCVPGIKHTSACSSAPCMGRMASPVEINHHK